MTQVIEHNPQTKVIQAEFSVLSPFYIVCLVEKLRKQKVQLINLQSKGLKVESEHPLNIKAVAFAQCQPDSINVSPLCVLQLTLVTAEGELH